MYYSQTLNELPDLILQKSYSVGIIFIPISEVRKLTEMFCKLLLTLLVTTVVDFLICVWEKMFLKETIKGLPWWSSG